MAIAYSCDSCGYQGKAADHLAGKKVKCKACQSILRIPDADADSDAALPLPLPPLPPIPPDVPDTRGVETVDADDLVASDEQDVPAGHTAAAAAAVAGVGGPDFGPVPAPATGPTGGRTGELPDAGLFGTAISQSQRAARSGSPLAPASGGGASRQVPNLDERFCPKCREIISKKAKLCRHCGFDLNFEHLLTEERVNIDVNRDREEAKAKQQNAKAKPRRSVGRILGTLVVLGGLFLPWLTGIAEPPRDISGIELAQILLGQIEGPAAHDPLLPQDEGQDIAGNANGGAADETEGAQPDDTVSVPPRPDAQRATGSLPPVLAAPSSRARSLLLSCVLALPVLALIALVWELVRGGSSLTLGLLSVVAAALALAMLGLDFGIVGAGFYVTAGGAVLMLIPALGSGKAA